MHTGILKTWNQLRGFGFISRGNGEPDVFMHITALSGSGQMLSQGQLVTFDTVTDARTAKERAINVRLI